MKAIVQGADEQRQGMQGLPQVVAGGRQKFRFGDVGALGRFLLHDKLQAERDKFSYHPVAFPGNQHHAHSAYDDQPGDHGEKWRSLKEEHDRKRQQARDQKGVKHRQVRGGGKHHPGGETHYRDEDAQLLGHGIRCEQNNRRRAPRHPGTQHRENETPPPSARLGRRRRGTAIEIPQGETQRYSGQHAGQPGEYGNRRHETPHHDRHHNADRRINWKRYWNMPVQYADLLGVDLISPVRRGRIGDDLFLRMDIPHRRWPRRADRRYFVRPTLSSETTLCGGRRQSYHRGPALPQQARTFRRKRNRRPREEGLEKRITQALRGRSLLNHAATQAQLAAVKNQRLPRCDRPLRRIELDVEPRRTELRDAASRVRLAITGLSAVRHVRIRGRVAHPGEVLCGKPLAQEQRMIVSLHDDQLVLAEILSRHVPRLGRGALAAPDADAFALADGVEGKPDVLSDDPAFGRTHRPRLFRQIAAQELAERALADEANSGRVALRKIVQTRLLRDFSHLGLLQLADRKDDARELRLSEAMQEVALVLGKIERLEQLEAPSRFSQPRIVPGRDALRAERQGVIEESAELDLGVAQHVRVGSAAGGVFREESAEDALLVLRREIHHLQLDADHLGDRGAVDQVLARRAVLVVVVVLPVLHEEADDLEPLAFEEQRGDRRIDAARHAYDYALACHLIGSSPPRKAGVQ